MPVDSKRIQGPEDSEDYHLYIEPSKVKSSDIFNDTGRRRDGRKWDEQRKIYMKTGVTSKVKGSSYLEVGNTKVSASVYEPREIPRLSEFTANGELFCEFRFAPFASKARRSLIMQADEKDLSLVLKRTLEPAVCRGEFPNCQVDIYVLVMDDDGSCFSTAVTAAGIALADAGIPMYDTIGAITLGIQGERLFLDPTLSEEEYCLTSFQNGNEMGLINMSILASLGQISNLTLLGSLKTEQLLNNLDLLTENCRSVAELSQLRLRKDVMRKCLEEEEANKNDSGSS